VLAGYVEEIGRRLSGRHGSDVIRGDVLAAARRHRVHLLLTPGDLAPDARPAFAAELRTAAALDAAGEIELRRLLSGLRRQRIDALLMKGAGLAYTVYRASHLRPRVDTDLLIRHESIDAANRVLVDAGWRRDVEPSFALAASQRHYTTPGPLDQSWRVDLHWRIANPHVFANAVTFDELSAAAIDVPALGEAARMLGYVHALYVACVHRVAHHDDVVDLLWLWDIYLLAEHLSDDERGRFVALSTRTSMTAVCLRGLDLVTAWLGPGAAGQLASALRASGAADEPSAAFLGGLTPVDVLLSDLKVLAGWRPRVAMLAEHALPSTGYMRSRYPTWPRLFLPFAYAHRFVRGLPAWFRQR
jgi:Uncharacterised nucleotidyltransferase